MSAGCLGAIYSDDALQFISSALPPEWGILDLVTGLMRTCIQSDHRGVGRVSVSEAEIHGPAVHQEASSRDSGLVSVTLTGNREGHVGVSGTPDTPTSPVALHPPPHPQSLNPRNNSVSFNGPYRQYFSFTTQPCASHSLMPWADVIYLIMACIDGALLFL